MRRHLSHVPFDSLFDRSVISTHVQSAAISLDHRAGDPIPASYLGRVISSVDKDLCRGT